MPKFVKVYLGIGVVSGCIAAREVFKNNPKLLESRDLVSGTADGILTITIKWPFILIDAVRNAHKKHKEEQTNESES